MNVDRLDQALDLIELRLVTDRIQIAATWRTAIEPMGYNTVQQKDFEILYLKGKPTKKFFHVIITRFENGLYETVCYPL